MTLTYPYNYTINLRTRRRLQNVERKRTNCEHQQTGDYFTEPRWLRKSSISSSDLEPLLRFSSDFSLELFAPDSTACGATGLS